MEETGPELAVDLTKRIEPKETKVGYQTIKFLYMISFLEIPCGHNLARPV